MTLPRKRKKATDRKAEIVDTAIRLSAILGPDRVTTQHLADEVGVTQPAIFRHFATKSEIWRAVGDHIVTELTILHSHSFELSASNPHDLLKEVVGRHFVHISANPAIPAILFSRELQAENEPLRSKFAALLSEWREAIARVIREAQEAGLHRTELVAEDAAQLVSAAIQGLSMRWILEDRAFDLTQEGPRVLSPLLDSFRA